MPELTVKQYVVGPVRTNCYFAINEQTKEMIIVDPGGQADVLVKQIEKLEVNPVAILLTHGHFDHVDAVAEMKAAYGTNVYILETERKTLENPGVNLSGMMGVQEIYHADHFLKDGEELELAGFRIIALHTPGHTVGSACYYLPEEMTLFSGDTLFCESVGRSDFPGGSASALIQSIREKLMELPDSVKVCPGHESETTIGNERMNNPFL